MRFGMQAVAVLVVIAFGVVHSGCSFFARKTQTLTVTTTEDDAEIYFDGVMVGEGTVSKNVPRNKRVSIVAKKPGFVVQRRDVDRRLGTVGTLDVVGAFFIILPAFGLLSAGAWELDKDHVTIVMHEEE
jgi:hypothetical protein